MLSVRVTIHRTTYGCRFASMREMVRVLVALIAKDLISHPRVARRCFDGTRWPMIWKRVSTSPRKGKGDLLLSG
jgi:hypothetical protein